LRENTGSILSSPFGKSSLILEISSGGVWHITEFRKNRKTDATSGNSFFDMQN